MRVVRGLLWAVAAPAWLWSAAALVLFPHVPGLARWAGVALFVVATVVSVWKTPGPWRGVAVLAWAVLVGALWSLLSPSADRTWAPDHAWAPQVRIEGEEVVIDRVRHALWRSRDDVDVRWKTRRYDLREIRTVDLVVEPFNDWRGPAHIFLTFGFADGEHVAISVEARREAGESYSIVRGAFRHFEVLYVIGDERDLIGMRANVRRHPVYLFPTRAQPAEARDLFIRMVERAQRLERHPEFYHSLFSTCATNLLHHVNEVRAHDVSLLDWRIAVPGYADELAWDLGLIDASGTLAEAREKFLINERSALDPDADGAAWSRQIRAGR